MRDLAKKWRQIGRSEEFANLLFAGVYLYIYGIAFSLVFAYINYRAGAFTCP